MDLISFPFRVDVDGRVATVEDGSEDHRAECVAVAVLTRKGERPLVPTFGVTDPTYADLDVAEVNAHLQTFGPLDLAVELDDAETIDDETQALTLTLLDADTGDEDATDDTDDD